MKKSIILSIAAAALVFAGCAKEESAPIAKKGTAFSVYATPDVKMSNDGLTSSWDNNDAIVLSMRVNPPLEHMFATGSSLRNMPTVFSPASSRENLKKARLTTGMRSIRITAISSLREKGPPVT